LTTRSDIERAPLSWPGPALGFFGLGLVAGTLCAAVGPIVAIRLLGAIAVACAALGFALVAYTWRCEDPAAWEVAMQTARAWRRNSNARWHRVWARRLELDRYWQHVVWSGMQ
jgi:hypothetical protein